MKIHTGNTRLDDSTTTVTWSEESVVRIGYHSCVVCREETPRPTMDVMIEVARERRLRHGLAKDDFFLWPGEHWTPPGWSRGPEGGLICTACTAAVAAALDARRRHAAGGAE